MWRGGEERRQRREGGNRHTKRSGQLAASSAGASRAAGHLFVARGAFNCSSYFLNVNLHMRSHLGGSYGSQARAAWSKQGRRHAEEGRSATRSLDMLHSEFLCVWIYM